MGDNIGGARRLLVLHAHWQPPRGPEGEGRMLFWAETPAAAQPEYRHGRLPKTPRPAPHPFCAPLEALELFTGFRGAQETRTTLRLPTTRTGPLPSPRLAHDWRLDTPNLGGSAPFLAPWVVCGMQLPLDMALLALVGMSTPVNGEAGALSAFVLADETLYWSKAAALLLEAMAAQRVIPVLEIAGSNGRAGRAAWRPVFDGEQDPARLAKLTAAMPPICRAEVFPESRPAGGGRGRQRTGSQQRPGDRRRRGRVVILKPQQASPLELLQGFLDALCDAAIRQWVRNKTPRLAPSEEGPPWRWLQGLFAPDARLDLSQAQLQALASSQRAWMRHLHAAGEGAFRIAFRLETPPTGAPAEGGRWTLHYLLQARDEPSLLAGADTVWETRGALQTLGRRFEQPQEKLLAGLGYAARLFPPISASLKSKRPIELEISTAEAYVFLREAAPLLESAGFGLLAPPWWNRRGSRLGVRLRLKGRGPEKLDISNVSLSLDRLVQYQWELSLGDTTLTRAEFEALAALKSPLVQIRGQWVQLDADQVEAAIRFWEKQQLEGEMGLLEALQLEADAQAAVGGLPVDDIVSEGWLADWMERFRQPERAPALDQPSALRGVLRPYQRFGFSWLAFMRRWGLGACLADDMGLGKTIQTLALLLYEKEQLGRLPAPTLLICPTSVVTNWEREIARFAPGLRILAHQGPDRLRGEAFTDAAQDIDLVLTSYALARLDAEWLQAVPWLGVILDEAQNIKNPSAKTTQSIRKLPSEFRLALTGTPVENRLTELWSILHFLNPGYLGPRAEFRQRFSLPIERYADPEAAGRLKKLVGPFILRRVKTDPRVIQDLPDKLEMKVFCHLTEEQATLYQAVVQDTLRQVEESEGIARRGRVLSMLTQLKQVCNHPAQFLHESSQTLSADGTRRSGKLERLVEMLDELLSAGDRALVFTQYAEMGDLLNTYLPQALGCGVQYLHGSVPAKAREAMVRRFQEDPVPPPVFILTVKAGGLGLNLTRANHVFHFDRWWNPAVEDQATDRAFRIGQTRNVQVHKFIAAGTLEERIDEMIESKKGLAQSIVGSGEEWLTELSTTALREMVELRRVG